MKKTLFVSYIDITVNTLWNDPQYPNDRPNTKYSQAAVDVATSLVNQLARLYPLLTNTELYDLVQVTPMIGLNDDKSMFDFDNVDTLSHFAKAENVNSVSMWSLTRDQAGVGGYASASYSDNSAQTKEFEYTEHVVNALKG